MAKIKEIIAGQDYIFRVKGNEKIIRTYGLFPDPVEKYDGEVVTVLKKSGDGENQRIYIVNTLARSIRGFWPPGCFQPVSWEFIVGSEYICDQRPKQVAGELWYGFNETMEKYCGQVLTCEEIRDEGRGARLRSPDGLYSYNYHKKWVRPASGAKQIKIVKRNVFNFWPGATTK